MNKLFEKLLNRKNKTAKSESKPIQKQTFDFVEKYILVNPNNLMMQYNLFSLCQEIPVGIETNENNEGWCETIKLPTKDFLPYLKQLENAPREVSKQPLMRTIFIIRLENNQKMYVFPNLKYPKNPWIAYEEKTLPFNVNPQINRGIVDCLKTFTR